MKHIPIKKRTLLRFWKKKLKPRRRFLLVGLAVLSLSMMFGAYNSPEVNPAAYTPLLDTIAKGESGGNYNAYYGNPKNNDIRFTEMTIGEVMEWQARHIEEGNISSAVGKYQIVSTTLAEMVQALGIAKSEVFNEAMQDRLAIALLERRGSLEHANDKLSREEFAANIAKEWAALPKTTGTNPQASYYSGDGINRSNIAVDEILRAIDRFRGQAKKTS